MVLSLWQATLRVHPVHMMNMERRQATADPQPRPNDPGCEFACRLPEATPTIAIYNYSAQKLILILPSHGGRRLSQPRHCSKGVQPVPKAVYRSGFHYKRAIAHGGIRTLVVTPQSSTLPLDLCDLQ